jgi:exopolyphosphatase/guanosine-5'-triphosphate,3'-diphosphate pyrophosphatase
MMAMALHVGLGGDLDVPSGLKPLADAAQLEIGRNWGLAIRVADRLAGGSAEILASSRPEISGGELTLHLARAHAALDEPTLRRRLQRLVTGLGLQSGRVQVA